MREKIFNFIPKKDKIMKGFRIRINGFIIIYVLLMLSLTSKAQKKTLNISSDTTFKSSRGNSSDELTQAYKLLYETAQKSYENQKETEHWFIGTVILFILFVVGSQIYFNFRFNRQVINNIQSEFDEKLTNAKSEQFQIIGKQKTELTNNLLKLFQDANKIAHQAVKKLNDEISNKITSIEKYNDAMFENIKTDHQKATLNTQIQFKLTSARVALTAKNYLSALIEFLSVGYIELESGMDVSNSLYGIYRSITMIKDLNQDTKKSLDNFLKKAKEIDDKNSNKIIKMIEKEINTLKIWFLDNDGNFKDEKGNVIDMDS